MTIDEINKIIAEHKEKRFNDLTYENKLVLIRMREVFSIAFNIPKDEIYKSCKYIDFFTVYIKRKSSEFDVNKIKMDLINSKHHDDDLFQRLALKYLEPIEVIKEIYQDIKDGNDMKVFIDTKLYDSYELSYMLNVHICNITNIPNFNTLTFSPRNRIKNYWLGKTINDNLSWLIKNKNFKGLLNNSTDYYSIQDVGNILGIDTHILYKRINQDKEVFGVKLHIEKNVNAGNRIFIDKNEVDKARNNKKYYIEINKLIEDFPMHTSRLKVYNNIVRCFNILYDKNFSFNSVYVKKETASKLLEFYNLFLTDFNLYIENICTLLDNGKTTYTKKEACIIVNYYSCGLSKIEKKLLSDEIIKKDTIIQILNLKLKNSQKVKRK